MDPDLANQVILKDRIVNRETRAIDALCHKFIVRHLPVGHHLRYVSSSIRLALEMERIGDYAVTICRHSLRCESPAPDRVAKDLELLGQQARFSLTEALQAFYEGDADRARKALGLTAPLDTTHDSASANQANLLLGVRVLLLTNRIRVNGDFFALAVLDAHDAEG